MTNLAQTEYRALLSPRKTRGRSNMIETVDTSAPQRRAANDIRSASRGDVGGADALLELADKINGAGKSWAALEQVRQNKQDQEDATQGLLDGVTGQVDLDKFKRSKSYGSAVTLQRAQRDFLKSKVELDYDVQAAIYNDEDPDPSAREAKVVALIDTHFKAFIMGEDGTVAYDGYPAAQRWIATEMTALRASVTGKATALIGERMNDESITTAADAYDASIKAGMPFQFDDNFVHLLPTVDRKKAKQAFLLVAKSNALDLAANAELLFEDDDAAGQDATNRALGIVDGLLRTSVQVPAGITPVGIPASTVTGGALEAPALATDILIMPFANFSTVKPTSKMGAPRSEGRSHNGEDFPMPVGTDLIAPRGGTVSYKWSKAGRHQAVLAMDNGDLMGIAHLSQKPVEGRVEAGAAFALSGNTGQTTGPHAHMTVTVGGKKVSPTAYFKDGVTAASGDSPLPPLADTILDPAKASEVAALADLPVTTSAPEGIYALTPEERYDLRAFKRSLTNNLNDAKVRGTAKRQTETAHGLLSRMNGLGIPPTIAEIREAAANGDISVPMFESLLNNKDAEDREDRAEARAVTAEAREADNQRREQSVDSYINGLIAPLASGASTPTATKAKLLTLTRTIGDREVRNKVISEVGRMVDVTVDLRKQSREHTRAVGDFTEWTSVYKTDLARSRLPAGVTRRQAEAQVETWVNEWVVQLAQGNVSPENVEAYMKRAETWLDDRVMRAYPPRAAIR